MLCLILFKHIYCSLIDLSNKLLMNFQSLWNLQCTNVLVIQRQNNLAPSLLPTQSFKRMKDWKPLAPNPWHPSVSHQYLQVFAWNSWSSIKIYCNFKNLYTMSFNLPLPLLNQPDPKNAWNFQFYRHLLTSTPLNFPVSFILMNLLRNCRYAILTTCKCIVSFDLLKKSPEYSLKISI